jgi:Protein of unknown function (DUF3761)
MLPRSSKMITIVASVLIAATSLAQPPASAPAGATGMCKDGSYWTGATKKGACHGHKGVQDWYGSAAPASGSAAAPTPATHAAMPAAPAATPPPVAAPKAASAPAVTQAPGGGAGQVWVNTSSKVYHCPSDRWYGKTKSGAYMSEADAIAQGNHPDHGKACSK